MDGFTDVPMKRALRYGMWMEDSDELDRVMRAAMSKGVTEN